MPTKSDSDSSDELNQQIKEFQAILKDWREEKFTDAIGVEAVNDLLREVVTYPFAVAIELGNAAAELLEKDPESAVNITLQLTGSEEKSVRAISTVIVARLARYQPQIWMNLAKHLAADDDWGVREYAAHIFDTQGQFEGLSGFHLDYCFEILEGWVKDENYLVRRAPTNALLSYYLKNPEIGERLIKLLDPLLNDEMEYVRRNHVFALRTIGKKKPELIFDYIESKLGVMTDRIREVFREVLEHKFADKLPQRKATLLSKLNEQSI
jgi:HEAT repeat protein